MTSLPKISIVTPSFNQGNFIEETITSVLNQNYPNLEYIIIDGGSTDNTIEVIKKYENHLTYWVSEPDQGQSHAINKGLQKCTGQVFNWLNSDDFLELGALKHIGEEYRSEPFTALCCQTNVLDGSVKSHVRKPSYLGTSIEDTIANYNMNQEGTWLNLGAVKAMGGVNTELYGVMDLDLWFKLLVKNGLSQFRKSEFVVSNFRRHADAKSTITSKSNHNVFLAEICSIMHLFVTDNSSVDLSVIIERSNASVNHEVYDSMEKNLRQRILHLFIFKHAKNAFYAEDFKKANRLIRMLDPSIIPEKKSDILYLKRKSLIKKFW